MPVSEDHIDTLLKDEGCPHDFENWDGNRGLDYLSDLQLKEECPLCTIAKQAAAIKDLKAALQAKPVVTDEQVALGANAVCKGFYATHDFYQIARACLEAAHNTQQDKE